MGVCTDGADLVRFSHGRSFFREKTNGRPKQSALILAADPP